MNTSPPIRALRAARVAVHVLAGLATTTLVFPFSRGDTKRALMRRWCRRLLGLLNVEARLVGRLDGHPGNVLIVANHVSWLDIIVLAAHRPARFVAKSEVARWPVAGGLVRGAGTLFVSREHRHDIKRVNHRASQVLADGEAVAVFPEGTTTDGTTVLRFHASLLQPIVDSQGHVQPVAIRYCDAAGAHTTAPAYVGDETFVASFWRVCGERRLVVELTVPPALPAQRAHRRELARSAEAAIRTALGLPAGATAPDRRAGREGASR